MAVVALAPATPLKEKTRARKLLGWQGFETRVPDDWDLTGFSGTDDAGYFRADDSEEHGLEVKWATEPKKAKRAPDVEVKRESYFRGLRQTAKKKRLTVETKALDAPRGVLRSDRIVTGFTWSSDRKAIGAVWHCQTCRRTVIVQVLGPRSGKGGLSTVAHEVLGSFTCHGEDPSWRTWALYDLFTQVPADYKLVGQQLMNVYLRLQFVHKTARLSIEQWSLATMARRDAYLDVWLANNSRGQITKARYTTDEGGVHGHATLDLTGGPAFGLPMLEAVREVTRLHHPATRFSGRAWECETGNKIYAIQTLRPRRMPDVVHQIAALTRCHDNDTQPDKDSGQAA